MSGANLSLSPAITQAQEEVDEAAAMTQLLQTAFRQAEIAADALQAAAEQRRRKAEEKKVADRTQKARRLVEAQEEIRQQYEEMSLDVLEQEALIKHRAMRAAANKRRTIRRKNLLAIHLNTKVRQELSVRGGILQPVVSAKRRKAAARPMRLPAPDRFVPPATPCATPKRYTHRVRIRRTAQSGRRSPLRVGASASSVAAEARGFDFFGDFAP